MDASQGLAGKVALVTGSSRGIGRAIAMQLASAGALVALNSTRDTSETERAIQEAGGKCSSHIADVSRSQEVNRLIETLIAHYGSLDILVANAGIVRDSVAVRMSDSDWADVLSTDLQGAFFCIRAALRPMLRHRWGRIITMGSVVGWRGNPGQANYAAAKAGLIGLTRTVAVEVASRGITANVVAPGFIETAMTAGLTPTHKEQILRRIPLGRFGSPQDVAEVVAFLASEDAGYISGQVLAVDGGLALA